MSMSDDSGETFGGRTLVAEFVLGLLDTAEQQRVGRLIEADPALTREKLFWEQRLSALDVAFAEAKPPATVYGQIERRLFGATVSANPFHIVWDSLLLWRGLAAGALAVAVVAIGMNLSQAPADPASQPGSLVALLSEEGSNVKFVALYDRETQSVKLTSLSGDAVADRDFELWAIQGGNKPVSLGVIPLNTPTAVSISADVLANWGEGSVLAVTLEPKGGSPSGDPTGPIVAKGAVTES